MIIAVIMMIKSNLIIRVIFNKLIILSCVTMVEQMFVRNKNNDFI